MKRNCKIIVKVSKEELDSIKRKCEKCGMTISSYIRFVIVRAEPIVEDIKIPFK